MTDEITLRYLQRVKDLESTLALVVNTTRPLLKEPCLKFSHRAYLTGVVLDAADKLLEEKP